MSAKFLFICPCINSCYKEDDSNENLVYISVIDEKRRSYCQIENVVLLSAKSVVKECCQHLTVAMQMCVHGYARLAMRVAPVAHSTHIYAVRITRNTNATFAKIRKVAVVTYGGPEEKSMFLW